MNFKRTPLHPALAPPPAVDQPPGVWLFGSFTRYFYKPQPMRALEEIRADILALEKETEGLLGEIVGGDGQ